MLAARRASVFASNSHHRLLASSINRAYSTQNINNEVTKEQSTVSEAKEKVTSKQAKIYQYKKPPPRSESRLTQYLRKSPKAMSLFTSVFDKIVTGNPRQVAGRITLHYYEQVCAPREAEEREFWHKECHLPPTFQTWFTVTNLHIWLLTVRFRALPPPFGDNFVQGLVDHFFQDVEDRIRQTLSQKAPERVVSRQMKIFREQWAGLGLSLDYALGLSSPHASSVSGPKASDADAEFAAAVWRNFLGARGALGIDDPGSGRVRHAVNIHGDYNKVKLAKDKPEESLKNAEELDDESGVHDFTGEDTKLYVQYPELMYTLVQYIRRELSRLDKIPDQQILQGGGVGKFGKIELEKTS